MPAHPKYPHVFTPLRIGAVEIRNRIFVPAHTTNYGSEHLPTDRHRDYHVARARGGAGLIIFEGTRVHETTLGRPQGVMGYDAACIPHYRRITAAVHAEGARIFAQVLHNGRQIDGDFERTVPMGPSPIRWAGPAAEPHAMNRDDMDAIRDGHVATARNMLAAGFDGLEVHVGHGHLLQQYLSPASNRREDGYGGSEERRLVYPLEVLAAVREGIADGAVMGIRISAEEFIDGGLHVEEMRRQLIRIADAVPLDFVHVSHAAYHGSYSLATQMADMAFDPALFRPFPGIMRAALRAAGHATPVFTVCKYRDLAEAEDTIATGKADMVGMARAQLAEPQLVTKAAEGRDEEIRTCLGCNQGCATMLEKNLAITCVINPRAGREGEWPEPEDDPAPTRRRVLVVGGGPAGMEAAWVAAARGHEVTLWERAAQLGGQINLIGEMRLRRDYLKLPAFQAGQLARKGVAVHLARAADAQAVKDFGADVVVLATGSTPRPMTFAGEAPAFTLDEAVTEPDRLGERVAVFDTTGEWSALSAVEHLAGLGKRLTVFTPLAGFAWRTTIYSSYANFRRLREHRVRIVPLHRVQGRTNEGLCVEDLSTGDVETWPGFDGLVAVQYNRPNDDLYGVLRAAGLEVRAVGDALAARTALEAVYEGHEAARRI